jgi:hypothetical protein
MKNRLQSPGTNVMILKICSPKKLALFTHTTVSFCKNLIITWVFEKNAKFFRRKLAKIAENCDHNIDHSSRNGHAQAQYF